MLAGCFVVDCCWRIIPCSVCDDTGAFGSESVSGCWLPTHKMGACAVCCLELQGLSGYLCGKVFVALRYNTPLLLYLAVETEHLLVLLNNIIHTRTCLYTTSPHRDRVLSAVSWPPKGTRGTPRAGFGYSSGVCTILL